MRKLNDTHSLLLSSASQRETGSLFPLPEGYVADDDATVKAIGALLRGKLVEQRDAPDAASTWHSRDDVCTGRCCQSNANRSPHDAVQSLSAAA